MTHPPYPSYADSSDDPEAHVEPDLLGLRPVRGLAIAAASIAAALTLAEILEAGFAWSAQSTYVDAAANGQSASEIWTAYDVIAAPWTVILLVAYVLTCLWLYRIRENAELIHPDVHHMRHHGWVWGGWVVPFASFFVPFQVVRDVRLDPQSPRPRGDRPAGWWWAFTLLALLASRVGSTLIGPGEISSDAAHALGTVETINAVLMVVALVLWLQIIRTTTRQQELSINAAG